MVKFWIDCLDYAINKTRSRIALCEKHGIGDSAMEEKAILKKQLHHKEELTK